MDRIHQLIERGIAAGLHPGAQLYVSRNREVIVDRAYGESAPGVPMTAEHLTLWMSACKPVTAVAIAQQLERGSLDLDDPVADHIPEFAQNGKEGITIRHLLTHTGGFRGADTTWKPKTWEDTLAMICAARKEPSWPPGEKAGYHVDSGWYVLGEIVRRLDGRAFCDYLREEIFLPLGMNDSWIGIPEDQSRDYGNRIARVWNTAKSPMQEHVLFSKPEVLALCRPGGNGRGPARELGRFFEELLFGESLLGRETVNLFTRPHRVGMRDHTFRHTLDWGLGFMIDSKRYGDDVPYQFGPHCSERTFGHGGNQSSTAFADPDHGLVVVLVFNGMPGEPAHQQRMREVLAAIYEEVFNR